MIRGPDFSPLEEVATVALKAGQLFTSTPGNSIKEDSADFFCLVYKSYVAHCDRILVVLLRACSSAVY